MNELFAIKTTDGFMAKSRENGQLEIYETKKDADAALKKSFVGNCTFDCVVKINYVKAEGKDNE